jgi:ribose transport system substrate-binding protein
MRSETGKTAAQRALDLLVKRGAQRDTRGKILQILGDPADSWSSDIQSSFEREIGSNLPKIDIVPIPTVNWDPDNVRSRVNQELATDRDDHDLKLIFAHAAELSVAVVQALRESKKKEGDILLMSSNGAPAALKNIDKGWQQAEIDEPVYAQVYAMALFLDDILNGRTLVPRRCTVLGVQGNLALDSTVGPIFTFSGAPIDLSNFHDQKFWGNLIPPKEDRPSPCQ